MGGPVLSSPRAPGGGAGGMLRSLPSLGAGSSSRPQMAPQTLEKIESAPEVGMGSDAPDPQNIVSPPAVLTPGNRVGGR